MKVLLSCALVAAVFTTPASARACAPLLTDPRGDTQALPAGDDPGSTDLLSADLRTTRTELVATIRVASLRSTPASHIWSLGFTSGEQRFYVNAHRNLDGNRYDASREVGGDGTVPEDRNPPTAALEGIGDGTGFLDTATGVVTIRVPLSRFAPYGGVHGRLYAVRAEARSGLGYPTGEVYELGDTARTDRTATVGRAAC